MADQEAPAGALVAPTSVAARDRFGVLSRSTLLRHTLFALVGFGLYYAFVMLASDVWNSTIITPIAYTVCAAAGLTLLVGVSGQISLGHGAFMMVGAYTTALVLEHWTLPSQGNLQLVPLLLIAAAVSAVFGLVVGLAGARLRGPYLAGATLALAIGLPQVTQYHSLTAQLGGNTGLIVNTPPPPSGFDLYRWQSLGAGIAAIVILWFLANVMHSRLGRSMRAVRDDEVSASLAGLSVPRVQILAFVISAACAGVGGALLALVKLVAGPGAFDLALSLGLLAAIVFGGLGSLAGAVYGSIVVVLLPQWSQDFANAVNISSDKITNNLPLLVYGVVLALAMLVFPSGLQGAVLRLRALVRAQITRRQRSRAG
jgi:branched-chain amino acid transport system permease protein